MPISKVKPLALGIGRHNIMLMNYDLKQITNWRDYYRNTYEKSTPQKIYRTSLRYVGIDENLKATGLSNSPIPFHNSVYGIVFFEYTYIKQTQEDSSFFALFVSENNVNEYLEENGWRMQFDRPITESYRTCGRRLIINKSNLKIEISFPNWDYTNQCWEIENKMEDCFNLFKKAQLCTTQRELDFLVELFSKREEIKSLNKQLIAEKMSNVYKEKAIEGYKAMLDEIKVLMAEKK